MSLYKLVFSQKYNGIFSKQNIVVDAYDEKEAEHKARDVLIFQDISINRFKWKLEEIKEIKKTLKKPEIPCTKDCPRRNAECHTYCPDWLTYQEEYKKYRKILFKTSDKNRQINDYERCVSDRKKKK
jgi:hypothetical protein